MIYLRILFGLALGFVVPGYLLARALRVNFRLPAAWVLSMLLLVQTIVVLQVLGIELVYGTVLGALAGISAVLGVVVWRRERRAPDSRWRLAVWRRPADAAQWALWGAVGLFLAMAALKSFRQPLVGWDTQFRWDYLPRLMLVRGNLDFYPPVRPGDFGLYFLAEGIPPLVQFGYFWVYTAFNSPSPALTGLLVLAQYLLLGQFVWVLARCWFGRGAARWAVAIAATMPLLFWSIHIGQETGWTAIALVGLLAYLELGRRQRRLGYAFVAGSLAAAGALAREYGGVFLLCGLAAIALRRLGWRYALVFALGFGLWVTPWYVRNWVVAGNPFFSMPAGSLFAVNDIYAAILRSMADIRHQQLPLSALAGQSLRLMLPVAGLGMVGGVAGLVAMRGWRRRLVVAACVVPMAAIWIHVGYQTINLLWTARVLSPALALGAVCGAALCARLAVNARRRRWIDALLAACVVAGAWRSSTFPIGSWGQSPAEVKAMWALPMDPDPTGFAAIGELVPPGSRVLSEDARAQVVLRPWPEIEVVPVWSPEFRWIFSHDPPERIAERLLEHGVTHVIWQPGSINSGLLATAPFYQELPRLATLVHANSHWQLYALKRAAHPGE